MRRAARLLLVLVGVVASAGSGAGAEVSDAVDAYMRALETETRDVRLATFREAAGRFERLLADGAENADLYANLGNAALQGEQLGKAILAYRRALRLDPDHPRATKNLVHARRLLPEWVPRPAPEGLDAGLLAWPRRLAASERAIAAAICFALASALVAGGIRFRQSALRNTAWVPGLAWLALLASLLGDADASDEAVVVAEEAFVRVADSALAPTALPRPLPAGTELRVLETRSPWLHVRLANGRDAWLAEGAAERVDRG